MRLRYVLFPLFAFTLACGYALTSPHVLGSQETTAGSTSESNDEELFSFLYTHSGKRAYVFAEQTKRRDNSMYTYSEAECQVKGVQVVGVSFEDRVLMSSMDCNSVPGIGSSPGHSRVSLQRRSRDLYLVYDIAETDKDGKLVSFLYKLNVTFTQGSYEDFVKGADVEITLTEKGKNNYKKEIEKSFMPSLADLREAALTEWPELSCAPTRRVKVIFSRASIQAKGNKNELNIEECFEYNITFPITRRGTKSERPCVFRRFRPLVPKEGARSFRRIRAGCSE